MTTKKDTQKDNRKTEIKQRYNRLALSGEYLKQCGCGSDKPRIPSQKVFTLLSRDYTKLKGHQMDADLGIGCGIPTEHAGIKLGDTVLDLGSGAGNDAFVALSEVGESGRVVGVDFAPEMVAKARQNAEKGGYKNIEFIEGDIEEIPLADATIDVVLSNCVLNLLPSKELVFHEIHRVLKPSGRFCISDIVLVGEFPAKFRENAALYAGCISTAMQEHDYLSEIEKVDFIETMVVERRRAAIPDHVVKKYLDSQMAESFRAGRIGIYSITVVGIKNSVPATKSFEIV